MKLAIMQPYFFPYVSYWQLLNLVDCFVIYDDVSYIKQGYINRNSILVDGTAKRITLEVIGASSNKLINQVEVGNNSQKILKTIGYTYSKAPYFKDVFPIIRNIIENNEKNLAAFLENSLREVSKYLKFDTEIICSSDIDKDNTLKSQEKIIDICKILGAKNYINAIGGQSLYHKSAFEKEKITLNFINSYLFEYNQFNGEFVPNLSIIDVMMFNSVEQINDHLMQYDLI